ncbi:zinc finger BED domain-containing protein RICESLEEPER 2-like [Ipomoea triloba]|uniref:zinc finger BED domain-containing protein RICESLEEPER 2-like n=1 Tax=Ipomoea triloba TaxID=35885 RepID=UPI00125E4906|nr:zinc finger BED domain-containing protein RICESLEEPER 2-like [Ipomoea triloba]
MENIREFGSQPSNSSNDGSIVVEAQIVDTNSQQNVQPTTAVPAKKRKQVDSRSRVWDHFERITDASDVTIVFVDGPGFRKFILVACPMFKIPSRWTISRDISLIYEEERLKGEYIAKALETCLLDWGIRNVYTITVDNTSSNDTSLGFLKKKLLSWGTSTVKAKYIHMRCIAHILNLVVQDGLKYCDVSVKKVRKAVRYVRNSPARLKKFKDLSSWIGIELKSSLCLDVPTRWNSTYLMLQSAISYQKVFEAFEESDSSFKSDLGESVPDFLDWESVKSLVEVLKCFYDMTIRISGSLYVTSNAFFSEISDLYCLLNGLVEVGGSVKLMGLNMKAKFEKYWGK